MNKITRLEFKADIASFTPNIIEAGGWLLTEEQRAFNSLRPSDAYMRR